MDVIASFYSLRQRAKLEREQKRNNKLVIKDMPYVYGLMAVCASSGLSPEASIRCVSAYAPSAIKDPMVQALRKIDAGQSFREALVSWEEHAHIRSLAHILVESMESGTSSLVALDSLGRDAMNRVRRQADTALKKLPVTMLFPLVVCILPAFILLSIVPTLINGFMSAQW